MVVKIEDILNGLKPLKFANESFFQIQEFEKIFEKLSDSDEISISDCILTPYYFENDKGIELYAHELRIVTVSQKDFEKHLLNFTGQETLKKIPENIIERQKVCYIELLKKEYLGIGKVRSYINYLLKSVEIRDEVEDAFQKFKVENLYFGIY